MLTINKGLCCACLLKRTMNYLKKPLIQNHPRWQQINMKFHHEYLQFSSLNIFTIFRIILMEFVLIDFYHIYIYNANWIQSQKLLTFIFLESVKHTTKCYMYCRVFVYRQRCIQVEKDKQTIPNQIWTNIRWTSGKHTQNKDSM